MIRLAPLQIKLLRDLRRLWAQALAIALVMAAGVATLVLGVGATDALERTRAAYYEQNRFADVFASATRAPDALLTEIEAINGVLDAEGRIVRLALVDMPDMVEPGSLLLVSVPRPDGLNRLHLRQGRLPEPGRADEAVLSQAFAAAHGVSPGSVLRVLINGRMREVTVTGIAISPEYIYALGPGDMMPDPRRFGIAWMPHDSLARAFDRKGAFDNLVLKLVPGASEPQVITRLDSLLEPYGGQGATTRRDQTSHAFLDAELRQLRGMSRVLPPIFLAVAAFLVNMTLWRLITLEREQIGLLKALGYGPWAIVRHYVSFVAAIAVIGILIGWAAGAWMGAGLAGLYARFFDFPYLIFSQSPQPYAVAAIVTLGAAVVGAVGAVRAVAWLPPAVAMSPPAPVRYRRFGGGAFERLVRLRQSAVMTARHLLRWPVRAGGGVLGVALAVAVLVGSLWSFGSIERMIDLTFVQTERQDATLVFVEARPHAALYAVQHMPGVLRAEPERLVSVRVSKGPAERRVVLAGVTEDGDLSRLLNPEGQPLTLPDTGVVLSEALAELLGTRVGNEVIVEVLEGNRRVTEVPVSGISQGYVGLGAAMSLSALNRLLGEGAMISAVRLKIDPAALPAFYAEVKDTPQAGFLSLKSLTLSRFRETMAENITISTTVYLSLAAIIAFGVVYNFARISLSEQGRELASLRVLGFTRGEVTGILYGEIAAVVLLAQPVGWLIGTGFAFLVVRAFSSELYRVPLVIGPEVYAWASLVVIAAALASALLVRGRINNLDMVEVLKTRE